MIPVSALGALAALSIAIFLILKKVPPAYGMIVGALAGGLIGGADLTQTVALMIGGAQGITTAVMRILAAGVLAVSIHRNSIDTGKMRRSSLDPTFLLA